MRTRLDDYNRVGGRYLVDVVVEVNNQLVHCDKPQVLGTNKICSFVSFSPGRNSHTP